MGDPGPVIEPQGEEGAGPELGSTEDIFGDHVAGGLLTIWLEEPAPLITQNRLLQLCGSWWADGWTAGLRETRAEARRILSSAFYPFWFLAPSSH